MPFWLSCSSLTLLGWNKTTLSRLSPFWFSLSQLFSSIQLLSRTSDQFRFGTDCSRCLAAQLSSARAPSLYHYPSVSTQVFDSFPSLLVACAASVTEFLEPSLDLTKQLCTAAASLCIGSEATCSPCSDGRDGDWRGLVLVNQDYPVSA